jgi:lipopolysaccharide transport system ATP-binding protein
MTDIAIRCEGLGKQYRIGERERYKALRDTIADTFSAPFRRLTKCRNSQSETSNSFWALKDISFEVKRGEVVGIIGRNGAGKSTLLKILSRITAPTAGEVKIHGRVGSLLEVGTGFHPELTGRENIFLNGAILGMKRAEIERKFDEIVAFSEVEKFIDTPVKRYSSGMYVRLAFAVAAHLEPEILVVDEVLAVGDISFQKKCLDKMRDVSEGGRTILYVSHDLANITKLCSKAILLNEGYIEDIGNVPSVIATYVNEDASSDGFTDLAKRGDRSGMGGATFNWIELISEEGTTSTFEFGQLLKVRVALEVTKPFDHIQFSLVFYTMDGISVYDISSLDQDISWKPEIGTHQFEITITNLLLYPGAYYVAVWAGDAFSHRIDYIKQAITFHVIQTPESNIERTLRRSDALIFQPSGWQYVQY